VVVLAVAAQPVLILPVAHSQVQVGSPRCPAVLRAAAEVLMDLRFRPVASSCHWHLVFAQAAVAGLSTPGQAARAAWVVQARAAAVVALVSLAARVVTAAMASSSSPAGDAMIALDRDVGKLEARMENVETELQGIRADVREIRDALVKVRGGWLLLTAAITLASAVGAMMNHFLPMVFKAGP
jgi:hypothetical protein